MRLRFTTVLMAAKAANIYILYNIYKRISSNLLVCTIVYALFTVWTRMFVSNTHTHFIVVCVCAYASEAGYNDRLCPCICRCVQYEAIIIRNRISFLKCSEFIFTDFFFRLLSTNRIYIYIVYGYTDLYE